jgi:proteasome lid subunit RPN8/RPN11
MVVRVVSQAERREAGSPAVELLLLPTDLLARIGEDLARAYPDEGCGVLLGRVCMDRREAIRVVPAENVWDGRSDRYQIDPEILRELLTAEGGAEGLRVLGFYHSHPDADPEPSATDRELAWPWYHYVIWPVREGVAGVPRAWRLSESGFVEIELQMRQAGLTGRQP